jgi:hypothetical protein
MSYVGNNPNSVSGYSGTSGFSGYSGISGSGTSGFSGYSGIPGASNQVVAYTNSFNAGTIVARVSGGYVAALADSAADGEVLGIVQTSTGNSFTIVYSGNIIGLSNLVDGQVYYLSDTVAGSAVLTPPSNPNSISKPILLATGSTTGVVINMRGIQNSVQTAIVGTGVSGYVSRWTGTSYISSGLLFDNLSGVGVGTTALSGATLAVPGGINTYSLSTVNFYTPYSYPTNLTSSNLSAYNLSATNLVAGNLYINSASANSYFTTLTAANVSATFVTAGGINLTSYSSIKELLETVTVTNSVPSSAANNFDIATQSVQYYTGTNTANFPLNIRGNSSTSLNSILSIGQSATVALLVINSNPGFYLNSLSIDGVLQSPRWQGGNAPSYGNANAIDLYTFTIIKTSTATYTVLANQTKYA